MYIGWSDASVRNDMGYIAYTIYHGEDLITKENFKVNYTNSYTLEKVALRALIDKVESLNISENNVILYMDHKGIYNNLQKHSKLYKQFDSSLERGLIRKYKSRIKYKNRKHNLAHKLTREDNDLEYYNFNIVKQFIR